MSWWCTSHEQIILNDLLFLPQESNKSWCSLSCSLNWPSYLFAELQKTDVSLLCNSYINCVCGNVITKSCEKSNHFGACLNSLHRVLSPLVEGLTWVTWVPVNQPVNSRLPDHPTIFILRYQHWPRDAFHEIYLLCCIQLVSRVGLYG